MAGPRLLRVAASSALALTTLSLTAVTLSGCAAAAPRAAKAAPCVPGKPLGASPDALDRITVCVGEGKAGRRFDTEVARTPEQQAKGMMFRTALADDKAMLFDFGVERPAGFWMRNTLIPLDIIFIRADGRVANIAARAEPYSEETRLSDGPVVAVLEIRGGLAAEAGIVPGTLIRWK